MLSKPISSIYIALRKKMRNKNVKREPVVLEWGGNYNIHYVTQRVRGKIKTLRFIRGKGPL